MLRFLIGLLGQISQILYAKKEMLPLALQNPASVSVLRGDVTCLGRGCEGKETFFKLFQPQILSFMTAKTNLSHRKSHVLCFAHTAQAFRMWESQPQGRNLILWQNPLSESCSNAGYPSTGLGLCLCRWRKMSVWALSRGQQGSQPQNRNSTFSSLFLSPPNINSSYLCFCG